MTEPHPVLHAEERQHLDAARDWLKGHFTRQPDEQYASIEGKLSLIDIVLKNGWLQRNDTWKLQALGIGFGDALAQKLMLDWVTVDDEYGCDPALNWPGTSIYSFPMTTISKRIEDGEEVNVWALFEGTCAQLADLAFSGRSV